MLGSTTRASPPAAVGFDSCCTEDRLSSDVQGAYVETWKPRNVLWVVVVDPLGSRSHR